jgi:hypothetical protein
MIKIISTLRHHNTATEVHFQMAQNSGIRNSHLKLTGETKA